MKKNKGAKCSELSVKSRVLIMYNFMPNQDFQVACEQIKALEATRCCKSTALIKILALSSMTFHLHDCSPLSRA